MPETYYICGICGARGSVYDVGEQGDWLMAQVPGSRTGELVIRCPEHITEYAIRKAGGHIEQDKGVVRHYVYPLSAAQP